MIEQDPAEASYDSMPRSALATTEQAEIYPAAELAAAVVRLVGEQAGAPQADPSAELEAEIWGLLAGDPLPPAVARDYGSLTCPDCGGPLYEAKESNLVSYDCVLVIGGRRKPCSRSKPTRSSARSGWRSGAWTNEAG